MQILWLVKFSYVFKWNIFILLDKTRGCDYIYSFSFSAIAVVQYILINSYYKMMKGLSLVDKLLPLWILLFMTAGILIGYYVPSVEDAFSRSTLASVSLPIAVGLLLMMYPVFCRIHYEKLASKFVKDRSFFIRQIGVSLVVNWIVAPLVMVAIAWATLPDLVHYRSGVILVGVARCIAMVLIWNHLAKGNDEFCALVVAINSVIQMFFYGPLSYFFVVILGGGSNIHINMWTVIRSVLIYMGIPLVAGILTRFSFKRFAWYERYYLPEVGRMSLLALLYVIIVMFAIQGRQIIDNIGEVIRTSVPLLIYFMVMFTSIFVYCYKTQVPYEIAVPQSFTAASNNFELAIAVAVGTYGIQSKEALAATIGPLIEVPVLVALVYVALFIQKRWYHKIKKSSENGNQLEETVQQQVFQQPDKEENVRCCLDNNECCDIPSIPPKESILRNRKKIIFACVHNAGRSQMAATFFKLHNRHTDTVGVSAGTNPADHVHPVVQETMSELGIDLSSNVPKKLTKELATESCMIVTMGCEEQCPYVLGVKIVDWHIEDPKNKPADQNNVREHINDKKRMKTIAVTLCISKVSLLYHPMNWLVVKNWWNIVNNYLKQIHYLNYK
ncbi:predicted protein [Heterostelium album PN500]|uniref:Phosphotyrosine protein phosphatase I domain-containing protein n=1 Tax=Heterostelium pallidum (strain ATCC 26659 / Pp 5 / PN500) TaxID=670386 RepID=D3BIE7_HETP5|nr:predicted protein [Heterostelium album PN500]EFA79047.1 predicted protein [Heterostelium album PN500]|eukprot:XP_020431170.1 predicted protein [Heterostelium album PN500]